LRVETEDEAIELRVLTFTTTHVKLRAVSGDYGRGPDHCRRVADTHAVVVGDRLVMRKVFIAQVSNPQQAQRVLTEAIKLSVERSEVHSTVEHKRSAAHAGETVRVFVVVAEVPAK